MHLRPYAPSDCPVLAELFRDTVHTVTRRDYTAAQRAAWADGASDLTAWNRSFLAHHTLVALEDGVVAGFGDLDPSAGYLDRLYVHRDFQRRGIASALCDALEGAVSGERVATHASITAKPFFLRRGYQVLREQQVLRHGVALTNFAMEKPLAGAPCGFPVAPCRKV